MQPQPTPGQPSSAPQQPQLRESSSAQSLRLIYIYKSLFNSNQSKTSCFYLNFVAFLLWFCIPPLSLTRGCDISIIYWVSLKLRQFPGCGLLESRSQEQLSFSSACVPCAPSDSPRALPAQEERAGAVAGTCCCTLIITATTCCQAGGVFLDWERKKPRHLSENY